MNYRLAIFTVLISFSVFSCSKSSSSGNTPASVSDPAPPPAPTTDNTAQPNPADEVGLKSFGVIREFSSTDTSAMFGLKVSRGSLKINSVRGPAFLPAARTGQFDQAAMDHLFLKSSKPMPQQERQDLVAQWTGAQVIYYEGYNGAFCTNNEVESDITVSGTLDGKAFETTFQFIALPNANGDCGFHTFGIITRH